MQKSLVVALTTRISLISLTIFPANLKAQIPSQTESAFLESLAEYQWVQEEFASKWSQWMMMSSADPQDVDVQQYTLSIEFFPDTYSISGEVTISAETLSLSLATLGIDCHTTLTVDSLTFDGSPRSYTHADDKITLSFDPPLVPSQTFTVNIAYHGTFTPLQEYGLIFADTTMALMSAK